MHSNKDLAEPYFFSYSFLGRSIVPRHPVIPGEELVFEPSNISWGSAFRGSKHLLTRYDWRMPAECLWCRWLFPDLMFPIFSAPHHTVWNWTRSDLITLMGRTGKPKQLEPCQQKALHNRSPNIAINFPSGRALCELLGLCEFFGCVLEGGAPIPSYWWSYGAPINGLMSE